MAIPKIVQQKIDACQLSLESIVVSNTQSENFTITITSAITSAGSDHATIDAFEGVLYLEDRYPHSPFATVNFPETDTATVRDINVTQFVPITNMEGFTIFSTWLLANDSLRITVAGNTSVHVPGISRAYPVTFLKTIEMAGMFLSVSHKWEQHKLTPGVTRPLQV